MKDAIIVFIIVLVVGSIINSIQAPPPPAPAPQTQDNGQEVPPNSSQNQGAGPVSTLPESTYKGPDKIASVSESNFQSEVLEQKEPVLIDFIHDNSVPCTKMRPIVNELANKYNGALKVVQIDIMDNPSIANKYDISAVPAFVLLDGGQSEGPFVGAMSKDRLARIVRPHLKVTQAKTAASEG
jgi:thioredoxin 1